MTFFLQVWDILEIAGIGLMAIIIMVHVLEGKHE